jgi:predicted CoA-binding protein
MNKKTLVFGTSINPGRYSHLAVERLINHGYEVFAFGLKKGAISDVVIDTELRSYSALDTITLYLSPERQVQYYDYLISLNPKRIIFNPGTENPEFYELLKRNNIDYEIACTLVLLSINQY